MLHVDVIRTPSDLPLEERLLLIADGIDGVVSAFEPTAVAVERVFAQANVRSVMGTAQVSGLALLAAARRGLAVATYTPTEVKAAITGNGRADKQQVTQMVQRLLRLSTAPKPADAADALAIAVCHAWRGTARARVQDAVRSSLRD
jgi:crossover junction endodeoxyribonuclease RuvC